MAKQSLGEEVKLDHICDITLFWMHKVLSGKEKAEVDRQDYNIDECCRRVRKENYPLQPYIGQVYGVYIPHGERGKWVRGRIDSVIPCPQKYQFNVFLIDEGQYMTVTASHLVQLNENVKQYPARSVLIALDGVIPLLSLTEKYEKHLKKVFLKGPVYFKEKRKLYNIVFGDIIIKKYEDGKILNLTKFLLDSGTVQQSQKFLDDAKEYYSWVENKFDEKEANQAYMAEVELKKESLVEKGKDTGYSSEDYYSEDQLVSSTEIDEFSKYRHEDTFVWPAGMTFKESKSKSRNSKEEIKSPRTFYQIWKEMEKSEIKKSRSLPNPSSDKPMIRKTSRSLVCKNDRYQKYTHDEAVRYEEEMPKYQSVFKPTHVTFGELTEKASGNSSIVEDVRNQKKPRLFSLLFNKNCKDKQAGDSASGIKNQEFKTEGKVESGLNNEKCSGARLENGSFADSCNQDLSNYSIDGLVSNTDNTSAVIKNSDTSFCYLQPENEVEAGLRSKKSTDENLENSHLEGIYNSTLNDCSTANPVSNIENKTSLNTVNKSSNTDNFRTKRALISMKLKAQIAAAKGVNNLPEGSSSKKNATELIDIKPNCTSEMNVVIHEIPSEDKLKLHSNLSDDGGLGNSDKVAHTLHTDEAVFSKESETEKLINVNLKSEINKENIHSGDIPTLVSVSNVTNNKAVVMDNFISRRKRISMQLKAQMTATGVDSLPEVDMKDKSKEILLDKNLNNASEVTRPNSGNSYFHEEKNLKLVNLKDGIVEQHESGISPEKKPDENSVDLKASASAVTSNGINDLEMKRQRIQKIFVKRANEKLNNNREGFKDENISDNCSKTLPTNSNSDSSVLRQDTDTENFDNSELTSKNLMSNSNLQKKTLPGNKFIPLTCDIECSSPSGSNLSLNSTISSESYSKHEFKSFDQLMGFAEEIELECSDDRRVSSTNQELVRYINNAAGVVVHTRDGQVFQPAMTLADSYLHNIIVQSLESRNRRELNRIQKISYPTITARRNMAMISPRRTGKTCGYIAPLASLLLDQAFYVQVPEGNGPKALVITPCWETGDFVASEFKNLTQLLHVLHTYGGGAELELQVKLLEGCDVLISTPRCFLRLLGYGLTNLRRLCHLVMDDADILFEKFKPEMEKIILEIDKAEVIREQTGFNLEMQAIISSQRWTLPLQVFVTHILYNPTICIASQLEACVYAGIKPKAIFIEKTKKYEKLVGILKQAENKHKTVIMCRSKEDVKSLQALMIETGVRNVIIAHEGLTSINISEIPGFWVKALKDAEHVWKQSSYPILIRSDEVLEEVPITDATLLIHYNMPVSLKTFSLRFISIMGNYPNLLKKDSPGRKPEVVILIDETNEKELPNVMEFMERLGTTIPEQLILTLEKIKQLKEEQRISQPLCEDLKRFGQCNKDVKSCSSRHYIRKELDQPSNIPTSGWVKVIVQFVHDASHYSVRLIEHAQKENEWVKLPSSLMTLPVQLNNYYGDKNNRRLHGYPNIGDVAALETSLDVFHRVVVLKILKYDRHNRPLTVNVRLIDTGSYIDVLVTRLYGLPEELKKPPSSVVDVYLCNIRPRDLDDSWPPASKGWVEKQLMQARKDSPNGYLLGKITLALGSNLWLDPLQCLEYLPSLDTTIFRLSLRQDLLNENIATENNDHLVILYELCEKAGIEITREKKIYASKAIQSKPSWAWLPEDCWETGHVSLIADPESLFVRRSYSNDCLQRLIKEIQEYARDQTVCDSSTLGIGHVCLGKPNGSEEWNRAIIKNQPSEDQVELFFVDFGDTDVIPRSNILPISNQLITKLPFQVIECYLAGVKFPEIRDSVMEDNIIDAIYDFTRNKDEEALNLFVKVCEVESKASYTLGKRYKVILSNTDSDSVVLINKELVSSGLAKFVEEDEQYFEELNAQIVNSVDHDNCSGNIEQVTKEPNTELSCLPSSQQGEIILPEQVIREEDDIDESDIETEWKFIKKFFGFENDADISDSSSEDSALSIPRGSGSQLPALTYKEDSTTSDSSCASPEPSDYHKDCNTSVKEEKETIEILNKEFLNLTNGEPLAHSSPRTDIIESHSRSSAIPQKSEIQGASSSFPKITGKANSFSDLISPSLFSSSSSGSSKNSLVKNVTPILKNVGLVESAKYEADEDLDNTVCEMNENQIVETSIDSVKISHGDHIMMLENIADSQTSVQERVDHNLEKNVNDSVNSVNAGQESDLDRKKQNSQKWVESQLFSSLEENNNSDFQELSSTEKSDKITHLEFRTPMVQWHQNDEFIWIHIKLPAIIDYEFDCDITSVHFRTVYCGVAYRVDLELFGGHKHESAQHIGRACYFEIKLEKLVKGKKTHWPRLLKTQDKKHWLKLNAEKSFEELEESDSDDARDVKDLARAMPLWNENPVLTETEPSTIPSEDNHSEISLE